LCISTSIAIKLSQISIRKEKGTRVPRRLTLTNRQREALLCLPVDQGELLRHYTLIDAAKSAIAQAKGSITVSPA
jgi:hypothetical protein